MKTYHPIWLSIWLLLAATESLAQKKTLLSHYQPSETFSPLFYSQNGNLFRSANGSPGPRYWQNKADYRIEAQLDDVGHRISGQLTISYQNNSPDQLPYLWLQLDQNSFSKDSRSTLVNQGQGRFATNDQTIEGGYQLKKIRVEYKGKPLGFKQVINDSRMQLRLETPLVAGGSLVIHMDYSYMLPNNGASRTGHFSTKHGEVYAIAQWFPRMCVYDDLLGWNTLPYLGAGEFYCEYGDISFSIDAPGGHMVMGSGELLNPKEVFTPVELKRWNEAKLSERTVAIRTAEEVAKGSLRKDKARKIWKYRITNSRDAAWASSSAFIVEAARINLPAGKTSLAISAHPVESSGQDSYGRAVEYVKRSVEHYSNKWFSYPYPMAVNVASNQRGIEYPGIVFCDWKSKGQDCWHVIDHEFGHTWFPMIVGTNERKYAWMDEGLNTFINGISGDNFKEYADGLRRDTRLNNVFLAGLIGKQNVSPVMTIPDVMPGEMMLGFNAYMKPGKALSVLREEVLGAERFDYALKEYIRNWAYKHPSPEDFFRSIENAAGEDLSWFWRGWFINNWKLEQSIEEVEEYRKGDRLEGYTIRLVNLEKMAMPVKLEMITKSGKKETLKLPVDIWMRSARYSFYYPITEELKSVRIQSMVGVPYEVIKNNIWTAGK